MVPSNGRRLEKWVRDRTIGYLLKDGLHDSCGPADFRWRNWIGSPFPDSTIEEFHELPHAEVHLEFFPGELADVDKCIAGLLAGVCKRC